MIAEVVVLAERRQLNVRVEGALRDWLRELAAVTGVGLQEMAERALIHYVTRVLGDLDGGLELPPEGWARLAGQGAASVAAFRGRVFGRSAQRDLADQASAEDFVRRWCDAPGSSGSAGGGVDRGQVGGLVAGGAGGVGRRAVRAPGAGGGVGA